MQLSYKQSIEIAEEEAINNVLAANKWDLTRRILIYDLTVLGIGCVKTNFNTSEGIKTEYVDPAYLVYSYTEDPNFEDIYYVGEIKELPINELVKEFTELSEEEIKDYLLIIASSATMLLYLIIKARGIDNFDIYMKVSFSQLFNYWVLAVLILIIIMETILTSVIKVKK